MHAGMSQAPEYLDASFILCHVGIIWDIVVHYHLREHVAACIAVISSGEFCKAYSS